MIKPIAAQRKGSIRTTKHPYITHNKSIGGSKPVIKGIRIKVSQIAIYYEKMRYTPDDIVQAHPHLNLAQVHDALSYYYENTREIDRQIAEERRMVEAMKKGFVSILEQKHGIKLKPMQDWVQITSATAIAKNRRKMKMPTPASAAPETKKKK